MSDDLVATNAYMRELGYGRKHRHRYRRASRPISDLVRVGSIVRTNYGTGPYVVIEIAAFDDRPPEGGWYPCYWLTVQPIRDGVWDRRSSATGWLTEVVPYGRRLLHLFENNTDEVFVIGFHAETARLMAPRPVQLDLFAAPANRPEPANV